MIGCFFDGFRHDRNVQLPADGCCDLLHRNACVAYPMEPGTGSAFLQCQSVKHRRIEPVDRRPAVETVTYIGRNAFLAGDPNNHGNETVIIVPMY